MKMTELLWFCTVFSDLSVPILIIYTVIVENNLYSNCTIAKANFVNPDQIDQGPVLQIRRGNRDKFGIISNIFL